MFHTRSKPRLHIWRTPHFFWSDFICLQVLLIPYPSASLYPPIPQCQNSFHRRHFHCSLQARLLQLSLSQPAQVSDHPAPTDPELSCTCCCQSSQIQSYHSYPPVSTLAKDQWAHWMQAPVTHLQSSDNHPTFISVHLITVQLPRSTRSSSLVTLARPSTSSSLRITDRSFQYASPRLWNQLPAPLRQPRTNLSNSASPSSEWHFLHWFHRLTTLIIHHPFTLSLQA